ncbi:serine protease [Herbiconiux sp. UC225_62]|uniref:S1 family peptidase n=1 Tax=Herbiconiux sp. UC225_62 TaxID=3350168 RepID=UPI0036D40EF0
MSIAVHSVLALYTELLWDEKVLATGTSFYVERGGLHFIVTNRHNVTGRNNDTDDLLGRTEPNQIRISGMTAQGKITTFALRLYHQNGQPAWREHPTLGPRADIVAIRFDHLGEKFMPIPIPNNEIDGIPPGSNADTNLGTLALAPGSELMAIGYPFGRTGGAQALGIWIRGTIATEPDVPFDDLPMFLMDARTRRGQSGSPVFFHSSSGAVPFKGGDVKLGMMGVPYTQFVGIYSGRISEEADLGRVWTAEAVRAVLDSPRRGVSRLPTGQFEN